MTDGQTDRGQALPLQLQTAEKILVLKDAFLMGSGRGDGRKTEGKCASKGERGRKRRGDREGEGGRRRDEEALIDR